MGLGKSFKKFTRKVFGDKLAPLLSPIPDINVIANAAIGTGVGFLTGGPIGAVVGAGLGAVKGTTDVWAQQQQEKMMNAQIASSEKIAQMQQQVVVSADPAPVQKAQTAQLSEANDATRRARAFRFSNSVRRATLGGGLGGSKTLG